MKLIRGGTVADDDGNAAVSVLDAEIGGLPILDTELTPDVPCQQNILNNLKYMYILHEKLMIIIVQTYFT